MIENFAKLFQGHDTTSAAISWCLFLLGSHPDIQSKCVQEINDILGLDPERLPTMQELAELKYLECCIKESLRLYPSVPLIARQLNEDVKIGERFKNISISDPNLNSSLFRRLPCPSHNHSNDSDLYAASKPRRLQASREIRPRPIHTGKLLWAPSLRVRSLLSGTS